MTWEAYRSLVRCHLGPGLGAQRLGDLDLETLEIFKSKLIGKIGNRSVNAVLSLLGTVLEDSVREGYLPSNPARYIRKLPVPLREMDFLTPEELKTLLIACSDENTRDLIAVAAMTGIRRGELLALRWMDIEFESGLLHIRRSYSRGEFLEPKTRTSHRQIDLEGSIIQRLRERRMRQGNPEGEELVFNRKGGLPIDPDNLTKTTWRQALRNAGLRESLRWHDLRHTYASLLLEATGSMKYVQRQLGHSSIQVTLDRYTHLLPDFRREAIGKLDKLVENSGLRQLEING